MTARIVSGRHMTARASHLRAARSAVRRLIALDCGNARRRVEDAWRIAHCDEFSIESALPPHTRDLCTVAYVAIEGAWAEVWLRTGRVELGETEVRWLSETPSYEGMRLHGSFAVEPPAGLTALSDLLAVPPAGWPSADLSIAPGDIDVTSVLDQVRVSGVIRNSGKRTPATRMWISRSRQDRTAGSAAGS